MRNFIKEYYSISREDLTENILSRELNSNEQSAVESSTDNEGVENIADNDITINTEELVSANAEVDEANNKLENLETAKNNLEEQNEIIGNALEDPSKVSSELVSVATNSYKVILSNLKEYQDILPSSNSISQEALQSNPYMVLNIIHQDAKGLIGKIGSGIKAAWEWLVKMINKLVGVVKNIFPNIFSTLEKLKKNIEKNKETIDSIGVVDKSGDNEFKNKYASILYYFNSDTTSLLNEAPDLINTLVAASSTALDLLNKEVTDDDNEFDIKNVMDALAGAYTMSTKFRKVEPRLMDGDGIAIGWVHDGLITFELNGAMSPFDLSTENDIGYDILVPLVKYNNITFKSEELLNSVNKLLSFRDFIKKGIEKAEIAGKSINKDNNKKADDSKDNDVKKLVKTYSDVIKCITSLPMEEIKVYIGFISDIIKTKK